MTHLEFPHNFNSPMYLRKLKVQQVFPSLRIFISSLISSNFLTILNMENNPEVRLPNRKSASILKPRKELIAKENLQRGGTSPCLPFAQPLFIQTSRPLIPAITLGGRPMRLRNRLPHRLHIYSKVRCLVCYNGSFPSANSLIPRQLRSLLNFQTPRPPLRIENTLMTPFLHLFSCVL